MAKTIGVCPKANGFYVEELTLALKRKSIMAGFSLIESALTDKEQENEKNYGGNRTSKILRVEQGFMFKGILKFRFSMGPDGNDPTDVPLFSNVTISGNDYDGDLDKARCYKPKANDDDLSLFDDTAPTQYPFRRYKADVLADIIINKINNLLIQ